MSEFHADRVNRLEDQQADHSGRLNTLERLVESSDARLTEEIKANAEERRANDALLAEERKYNEARLDAERKACRNERIIIIVAVAAAVIASFFGGGG
ncbi:MAG: hypothetical protein ISN28_04415 [Ectothiorhodospiraceae bacterium AqS1]|nr:hypothetical protein [Ectothiorhodospiraceae bacterium AqS1]